MKLKIFILCIFFAGCASKYLYQGSNQAEMAKNACSIDTEKCFINYDDGQGKTMVGFYSLDRKAGGGYLFRGSVKVDISATSKEYRSVKKLHITFIFFNGDLVVHEEVVKLKGAIEKYLDFSLPLEVSANIDSLGSVSFSWILSGQEVL